MPKNKKKIEEMNKKDTRSGKAKVGATMPKARKASDPFFRGETAGMTVGQARKRMQLMKAQERTKTLQNKITKAKKGK